MAIFGAQAVVTLVLISFLQKICPIYSLGRWLLTKQNLVRYLHPTDNELKKLMNQNKPVNSKKSKGKQNGKDYSTNGKDDGSFSVPRSLELTLSKAPVSVLDILTLRFYSEFIWLMDFFIATCIVVLLTYTHEHCISPQSNEYGLSFIWCCLLTLFSIKPLMTVVNSYRLSQNSGEIVLSCLFGFFFLIAAMLVLIVDDVYLEFGIVPAHKHFKSAAQEFMAKRGIQSFGPTSLVTFRAVLALLSGFIGLLLTFPGIRLAKCHLDSLIMLKDSPVKHMMVYLDLLAPMFLMAFWVPPISRNVLVGQLIPGTDITVTNDHFDLCRDICLVVFMLIRMGLLRYRLQAYLNTAWTKVESMRKETGKITNRDLQAIVSNVFYYLCVVAIQLVTPLVLLAATLLMAKAISSSSEKNTVVTPTEGDSETEIDALVQSVSNQIKDFTVTLAELRSVFSTHLLQSMTSYFTWYILFAWTFTTYFGLVYHTFISKS